MNDQVAMVRRQAANSWRNRWYAVAAAWVLCIAGWVGIGMIPNVYQSSARLYVDADAVLTPLLKGLALDNTAASQLEIMQRTLLSRPNLDKVISNTPLELSVTSPADREGMVTKLGNDIKVMTQTRNLFTISYRNADPQVAYDVVQAILSIFMETRSGFNRTEMSNAQAFLEQQIATYELQLRAAEAARADFRTKYLDLLPADATGASHLDAARTAVTTLAGQLADATAKRARLQSELSKTTPTTVVEIDPATEPGRASAGGGGSLAAAQRRLQEMLLTETDNHPDVVHQRQLIAMLRANGGSGGGAGVAIPGRPARTRSQPNPYYDQLRGQVLDTSATIDSLTRQVADATAERDRLETVAHNVPEVQARFTNMDRDYETLRKNYDELLARREAMRLSAAADAESDKVKLRVVDPAQVSHNPISPPRTLLTLAVLAGGLAAGVVVAVGLSQLDRSFMSIEDLLALGLPVIGGISLVPGQIRRRRAAGVFAVAATVLLLCAVCGGLVYRIIDISGTT